MWVWALSWYCWLLPSPLSSCPKIEQAQHKVGEKVNDSIWRHLKMVLGAIGIFLYVGAEDSIGSFLVKYYN